MAQPTHKTCNLCRYELPFENFTRAKNGKYELHGTCNSCRAAQQRQEYSRRPEPYKQRSAKYANGKRRKDLYGITAEGYAALLERQGGRCAICCQPPKTRALAVDHDHTTGEIRGLLCGRCNMGLGLFGEDPKRVAQASRYLQAPALRAKLKAAGITLRGDNTQPPTEAGSA